LKAPAQTKAEPPARTADQIEDDASAARRAGDYARAAALYKQAAALRTQAAPARAAWDMAHAVECLAAGGNVAEAIQARRELLRSFPDQQGPRAAADSALRTVPLPPDQDAPAQK
jgi:tetratricopeptide (TPR) repeat protein